MKAILVIDMPKNCAECKLIHLQGIGEGTCNAVEWEERPSRCPLRLLPQKKETRYGVQYSGLAEEYRKEGWNECLDAILGEME